MAGLSRTRVTTTRRPLSSLPGRLSPSSSASASWPWDSSPTESRCGPGTLPARSPAGWDSPRGAEGALEWAARGGCGGLGLVGSALSFIYVGPPPSTRTTRRAGTVPPAHAADLGRCGPVGATRLGRECGSEGLQRIGHDAGPEGGSGGTAAPNPAVPLQNDARRCARHCAAGGWPVSGSPGCLR